MAFETRPPAQAAPTASRRWRPPVGLVVFVFTVWLCAAGLGPVPPLGPFLEPTAGIWSMPASAELARSAEARVPGLVAPVNVLYDDRGVPHVFATSEYDAYRALGFVVARDRLFQLELQTLAASGRLTEVVGKSALPLDREMRGLGLPRAAERKMSSLPAASPVRASMDAFADGVNAWITSMSAAELPFEHRLLGRLPSRWQPVNTLHLLNRMSWTLTYDDADIDRLATRARVGGEAADALFPNRSPIQEPIQPNGTGPRYSIAPLPPPGEPDADAEAALAVLGVLRPSSRAGRGHDDAIGSNNWAVAPSRTAGGAALLAGDPHLDLTLPSIWYEAQLTVPGVLDVYGVTIPGTPSIVIGFNRDVAWTFTNSQADVIDFYEEVVDDQARPARYRLDGVWRPLETRIEPYRGRRGETIAVDTIRFSHRGPLRRSGKRWLSMRWTALDDGIDVGVFGAMSKARSAEEFRRITEPYVAPPQNMLVADRAGHIAIRTTGRFPQRPGDGRGDVIRAGDRSANDWQGTWPLARYPGAVDPSQGFLASANQQPVDPNVDPGYLGSGWFAPWRAIRINSLLRAGSAATPDLMRRYQTDPGSARADFFVPVLLGAARARPGNKRCAEVARLLAEWPRTYTRDNRRAVLFEETMSRLAPRLWDELAGDKGTLAGQPPSDQVTAQLTADSASAWWDDRRTIGVERRDDTLCAAMESALDEVVSQRGKPDDVRWRWDRVRFANVRHLLRLPALSALSIPIQGGPSTLNPSSGAGSFGASWRMVVELGPEVRGWGTYPGGQSGNPLSSRYLDRMPQWTAGALDTLQFPRKASELPGTRVRSYLTLMPAK